MGTSITVLEPDVCSMQSCMLKLVGVHRCHHTAPYIGPASIFVVMPMHEGGYCRRIDLRHGAHCQGTLPNLLDRRRARTPPAAPRYSDGSAL